VASVAERNLETHLSSLVGTIAKNRQLVQLSTALSEELVKSQQKAAESLAEQIEELLQHISQLEMIVGCSGNRIDGHKRSDDGLQRGITQSAGALQQDLRQETRDTLLECDGDIEMSEAGAEASDHGECQCSDCRMIAMF
jgi:hypothetical protein